MKKLEQIEIGDVTYRIGTVTPLIQSVAKQSLDFFAELARARGDPLSPTSRAHAAMLAWLLLIEHSPTVTPLELYQRLEPRQNDLLACEFQRQCLALAPQHGLAGRA